MLARKSLGSAYFLMSAAREESVKFMFAFSWDHLGDDIKKKIYQHNFKLEVASLFHYLSGRIEMSELAIAAFQMLKDYPENDPDDIDKATKYIHNLAEFDDPRELATHIVNVLNSDFKKQNRSRLDVDRKLTERDRQNSIYVDFDDELKIVGASSRISIAKFDALKRDVSIARYYVGRLRGKKLERKELLALFPDWEGEFGNALVELRRKLDEKRK